MGKRELIVKDTHRALWYEDGVLKRVLEAGRYLIPRHIDFGFYRTPRVEVGLVDIREREITIKGQEILTSDKVAIRVSIIVQFRVVDPRSALHKVTNYEERLYSDVQLAARRSLASMMLEQILTNRTQLSEDILREVKEAASSYGVEIIRADVKDLIFPGNLQEVMNKVLAAERLSQAQLVEARTKAELQAIDARAKAEARRLEVEAQASAQRLSAETNAEIRRIKTHAEVQSLTAQAEAAGAYASHPALLRLQELETLRALAQSATARLYINFGGPGFGADDNAGEVENK